MTTALSQGKESNHASGQPIVQWQKVSQDDNKQFQYQHGLESVQQQEQPSSEVELKQLGSITENQQPQNDSSVSEEHNRLVLQQKQSQDDSPQAPAAPSQVPQTTSMQISEKNPIPAREPEKMHNQDGESQFSKIQKMGNQQGVATEQAGNPMNRGKQVPFALLLPALVPHLDKDRAMQLHTLYGKLKVGLRHVFLDQLLCFSCM